MNPHPCEMYVRMRARLTRVREISFNPCFGGRKTPSYDGRGFDRNEEVDLERMKRHYEHSTNGHHAEVDIEELQPADDN